MSIICMTGLVVGAGMSTAAELRCVPHAYWALCLQCTFYIKTLVHITFNSVISRGGNVSDLGGVLQDPLKV